MPLESEESKAAWNWGLLRRIRPVSAQFGYDRGTPIDRYYIERFLAEFQDDIAGSTLEVGDDTYTARFGGNRTARRDVLHVHHGNPQATIVGDLSTAEFIPADTFDCLVLTQTLQLIFDVAAAINTMHRIMRPSGVALVTFPGISQVSADEWSETWYWGLSASLAQRLFSEKFGSANVMVRTYGNNLAAAAFLQGLAASELTCEQLEREEKACEMLIAVRAVKPD